MVERLEVEWPGTRKSLAVAELRNRRGQLRAATLIIDRAGVESRVAAAKAPEGQLGVALEPGRIVVTGRPPGGNGHAGAGARLTLGAGAGRRLQISVDGQTPPDEVRDAVALVFGMAASATTPAGSLE